MSNLNLNSAKSAKNDEFYSRYEDIEKEIQSYLDINPTLFQDKTILLPCDSFSSQFTRYFSQNFEKLGLRKVIGTSLDCVKYTITKEKQNIVIIFESIKEGSFLSEEVTKLKDEVDFIITNPPFSLFRQFVDWIGNKSFSIVGNINAVKYKNVFPLIKNNRMWLGSGFNRGLYFYVPKDFVYANSYNFEREKEGKKVSRVAGACWFTNIENGKRHEKLKLKTMEENLKDGRVYSQYDNYKAIEVSLTTTIPLDYECVMGVPISFINRYNPEQFEILGMASFVDPDLEHLRTGKGGAPILNGKNVFARIFIQKKN